MYIYWLKYAMYIGESVCCQFEIYYALVVKFIVISFIVHRLD